MDSLQSLASAPAAQPERAVAVGWRATRMVKGAGAIFLGQGVRHPSSGQLCRRTAMVVFMCLLCFVSSWWQSTQFHPTLVTVTSLVIPGKLLVIA